MKKQLSMLMLLAALLVPWASKAQSLADYTLQTGTETYTSIANADSLLGSVTGDAGTQVVNLPFFFPFGEDTYNSVTVRADGYLYFGTASPGHSSKTAWTSTTNYSLIAPLITYDGKITASGATSGAYKAYMADADNNMMVVIEFKSVMCYYTDYGNYNYQVRLYPNGNISVVYGANTATTNTSMVHNFFLINGVDDKICLTGSFASPSTSSTLSNLPNLATMPANGKVITYVRPVVTCPKPTFISAITETDQITFYWPHGGSETDWELMVDSVSYFPTDTFYTLTGLTPSTQYVASVRSICGSSEGDTSGWRTGSFRTECVPLTAADLPYFEDFEDYGSSTTSPIDPCWSKGTSSTTAYPYPSSTVVNGSRSLYFYGYYPSSTTTTRVYSWAALPPIDEYIDMSTLMLTMKVKRGSSSGTYYTTLLYIGIADSLTGLNSAVGIDSSVTWIDTLDYGSYAVSSIHDAEVSFAGYTGTGKYVVIYAPIPPLQGSNTYAYNYAYVDDVALRVIPTCYWPTDVSLESVTIDGATVSWTPDSRTPNPGSWIVEYGVHGFTLGNGTTETVTDTTITLTGLNANTQYDIYVSADCGSGDVSEPAMSTFRTECTALDSLPYSNGFEEDPYYSAVTYAEAVPYCWHRINDATGTYNYYPYITTTASYVHSGTKGMYWYQTSTSGYAQNEYAILPPVDLSVYDMSDLTLAFYAKTTSTSYHPMPIVGVMTNPNDASTFTAVYTFTSTEITTDWQMFTVSFANYTGSGNYIAIKWPNPGSTSYMAIDDIYLTDDWCNTPASVALTPGATDITITWNANGGSSFTVILGTDTVNNVTDTFYTFTGLTPSTQYTYSVYTECTSEVSMPVSGTVRTLCTYLDSLPYFENFDGVAGATSTSVAVNNLPPCWSNYNVGTSTSYSGYPIVYNSSTYAHSGAQAMRFYNYITAGTYADQYGIMPMTDSTEYPINALKVNFWMRANTTSYNSWVVVGVMTNPSDASSFVPVQTIYTNSSTTYANHNVNFGSYTGAHGCVAFKFPQPTSGYNYGYVDDVTLEVAPTCAPVVSHNVTATASAARITWDYDHDFAHGADSYEVSYGYASDNLVGATTVSVTDPIVVLTALDADTTYKVSIQPICTDGTASAHVFNFNTAALPCAEWDTAGFGGPTDTLVVGTPGTSTTDVMPVNTGYNYSYCQHLIRANEVATTGPTTFSGIGFDYAYTSPMTHANNCQIYMGNTTRANFNVTSGSSTDSMFVPYSQLTLVYQGPLNCTASGWNYFAFNQGVFSYDGTSNIVVAIVNNSGATNSSAIFRYETTSGSAMTHRVYNSTTPYGPTEMDAARANQSYWRSNMKLLTGGGECILQASCYAPSVAVQQDDEGDVEVTWLPGYQETSWDLDYKAGDTGSWVNVLTGTNLTSYTFPLASLVSNTHYTFRVTPNCTDTVISGSTSFTTPCVLYPVPFSEDFDTWSSTVADPLPSCWDKHTNYSTNYPYASTSYNHGNGGGKSMYMYSTNTTYSYMVLPQFDLPIDSTVVSFWLYKSNTSYAHSLKVGVMTDPDSYSSFVEVATVTPTATSTWEPFEVSLASYTGTGRYIAIMSPNGVYSYPYLDDLVVDRLSPCPRVENVAVDNIMQTTATVSWDTTSATDYFVEYGPAGFTPGTGTVVNVSNNDSVDLTGLAASTAYDVYVRALCSPDTSSWSYVVSFFTACDVITVLPYIEDFESYGTGSTQTINSCWTKGTNSSTAYPYPYSSNAVTGQRSLYFYAYHPSSTSTTPIYSYVALPQFQELITNLNIEFKVRTYSSSGNYYTTYLLVGVMSNPNDITTFTAVDTVNLFGAPVSSVHDVSVSFANYTGTGLHIAIYDPVPPLFGSSTYNYSYAYVDDIMVGLIPTCPRIDNLTVDMVTYDSVQVSWTPGGTETEWSVSSDGITWVSCFDSSYIFSGLTPSTEYTFHVKPVCSVGDTGYERTIVARTTCVAPVLPYDQNFDGITTSTTAATGITAPCWDAILTGSSTYTTGSYVPQVYYSSTNAHSGSYSYRLYGVGYHMLPPMPTSLDSLELTFWDYTTSTSYGLEVGVMEGNTFVPVQTINTPTSTHMQHTVYFATYTGNSRTIAFRNYYTTSATTYYSYHYIDDVHVGYLPTCAGVMAVTSTAASTNSITVDWTDVTPAISWQLRYGLSTSSMTTVNVNSHPFTVTGLDSLTNYVFEVRPICSVGDTGAWSQPVSLSTEACDNAVVAFTGPATGTGYYTPLNNYYNYTLTETIIDSAELVGMGEISSIAYHYAYTTASTVKTDVTIWLQPTNKTVFTSGSDMVALDPSTAVQVYHGNLNCSQGWNYFAFDTSYTWNGQGNLLVIVDDNSYDYDGSAYVFSTSACTGYKTIYWYSDSDNPSPTSLSSFSGNTNYAQYRATMKLVSCNNVSCPAPTVTNITHDYQSATINVAGNGTNFELEYGTSFATLGNTMTSTTGQFNITGLTPGTQYFFHVRQDCVDNETSLWTEGTFSTDTLFCAEVSNLEVTGTSYNSVTLSWTPVTNEHAWEVTVYSTVDTHNVVVELTHTTVSGLIPQRTYNAKVRPLCGSGADIEGPWSENPVQFTTDACQPVTNVEVSNITTTNATVSWTAPADANTFRVAYGYQGFSIGDELGVYTASGTSYMLGYLEPDVAYTVQVATLCTETLVSAYVGADFTTPSGVGIDGADMADAISLYPNPASTTVTLRVGEQMVGSTVSIVDVNGRVVMSETLASETLTIDLNDVAKGAYFVRLTGEQATVVRKLIVK